MTTLLSLRSDEPEAAAAVLAAPWSAVDCAVVTALRDPGGSDPVAVLAVARRPLSERDQETLLELGARVPVLLVGAAAAPGPGGSLAGATGLRLLGRTPEHEIRVRRVRAVAPRDDGDLELRGSFPLVDKVADDVVVLATANVAFTDHPVLTWCASTGIGVLTVDAAAPAWEERGLLALVRRWADLVAGRVEPEPLRVGMLGYGAIGHEHGKAFLDVPGYVFTAVCDPAASRVEAARSIAPDVRAFDHGDLMLASDDVDLVVVSTPPDTHARLALQALDAGKHVLLEKPMALSSAECDEVLARADEVGRTAVVYQNRRWDPDYLALRRAVRDGRLGEVFHAESFVGGYGHPCNYWHSDAAVSGGAIFDWGSHFIDQLLDLLPRTVRHVTANNHKRVWHDVTNADHARVTIAFDDGTEAEFTHSDIAAAAKPKWYVLGTAGAVVGSWRTERVVARSSIGTLVEDELAPADSPAVLDLYGADGSVTRLATPPAARHAFHRELADRLLDGFAMTVDPRRSRDVVAVMEAAERSARDGGRPVVPA